MFKYDSRAHYKECSFAGAFLSSSDQHLGGSQTARQTRIPDYKAMFVLNDRETGIFSDELVVNCGE